MTQITAQNPADRLYDDVVEHNLSCQLPDDALSSTTVQYMRKGSPTFSHVEMQGMLSPGSPVNKRIRDLFYMIDAGALDPDTPIVRRILRHGESDVGQPDRRITVAGMQYSVGFLLSVAIGQHIIQAIEDRGLDRFTLLEIGGGLGQLQAVLRSYFGDRMTLIAVDVPDVLMIQEWYLRSVYPGVTSAFVARKGDRFSAPGGFTFLNAGALDALTCPIDVAINVDSLSDMRAETADAYLSWLSSHLAPDGFAVLINSYGQSAESHTSPAELAIGTDLRVENAKLLTITTMGQPEEQMLLLLSRRDAQTQTPDRRRLALRYLWNGYCAGLFADNDAAAAQLLAATASDSDTSPTAAMAMLVSTDEQILQPLADGPHLPQSALKLLRNTDQRSSTSPALSADDRNAVLHAALERQRARLCIAMEQPRDTAQRDAIATALLDCLPLAGGSPFWIGQIAGMYLPLFGTGAMAPAVVETALQSPDRIWRVRMAHLLARFGAGPQAGRVIDATQIPPEADPVLALKISELLFQIGRAPESHAILNEVRRNCPAGDRFLGTILAKTALRVAQPDAFFDLSRNLDRQGEFAALYDLCLFAQATIRDSEVAAHIRSLAGEWTGRATSAFWKASFAALAHSLGTSSETLDSGLSSFADDYYPLAGIGARMLRCGLGERGAACLTRSAELNPHSFLHQEFIGTTLMDHGMQALAIPHLQRAAAAKPYLLHLQAKAAFPTLPAEFQIPGKFGLWVDLPVIFQRWQDHYHDIGPKFR
jgi:putative sugar O-methyltransferase